MHDVEQGAVEEAVRNQDLVELLRIAVEIVGVAVRGGELLGKLGEQCRAQLEDAGGAVRIRGRSHELPGDQVDHGEELEVVEIAQRDDAVIGRQRVSEDAVDIGVDRFGLTSRSLLPPEDCAEPFSGSA